ncbi:MAG: hypothetical protein HRU13_03975 [Phycisphaerales bacterium]|nr:hypothetical protein [Phycisphaerales bacterium]
MFTRIRNGWALGMASLELLMENKKLVVFPLLSSIAALIVVASFVVPIVGTTTGRQIFMSEDPNAGAGPLLVLFLLYFCCYFVMLFFNAALVGVTMMHLDGRPYKLTDGLRIAWDRFSLILMWAVIAASVGFAIKMIEQRSQLAGKIVALLLGSAWTAMTYFVVPVLIVERAPAHKAIGRSFSLVKQTWGEGLVANWANSIVVGIGMIPGVLVVIAATSTGDPVIGGLGFLVGFAWIGLMVLVSMTLDAITNAVLYATPAQASRPMASMTNCSRWPSPARVVTRGCVSATRVGRMQTLPTRRSRRRAPVSGVCRRFLRRAPVHRWPTCASVRPPERGLPPTQVTRRFRAHLGLSDTTLQDTPRPLPHGRSLRQHSAGKGVAGQRMEAGACDSPLVGDWDWVLLRCLPPACAPRARGWSAF